jgi:C-terminal processing protease CtpA/Prc
VLLVDEETHGLGEFFVAAIRRANPRVRVIGAPTAGEATLPGFIALGDAQHLRFPAQRLSLEDGSTWERRGLQPDLLVPGTHTSLLPPPSPPPDLQLDAAHHVIQAP